MTPPIKNVAIVGASGHVGAFIVDALLKQGKHNITAITRPDSQASMPTGLHAIQKVDYASHASLVSALKGMDFLIISLNVFAPKDTQTKLIDAAIEAGVRYIMPNEYGGNYSDEQFGRETGLGPPILAIRKYIEEKGGSKTSWIALSCGFWYEFSLSGAELRYGFDFKEKKLTLFDDGEQKHTCSTWPQAGHAVATLLALPETGSSPCLSDWKNTALYMSSFRLSQRDMLASVLRVTGTKESDWTITHEGTKERYARGQEMLKQGDWRGFGMFLYTRSFFPDGKADLTELLENEKLGLSTDEDLDEATKVAIEYVESGKAAGWS